MAEASDFRIGDWVVYERERVAPRTGRVARVSKNYVYVSFFSRRLGRLAIGSAAVAPARLKLAATPTEEKP